MKIIFDNDVASDDVMALVYLASHPKVQLAAITVTGTGEAHGLPGAKNMANLIGYLGMPNVPIAYGDEKPCDDNGKPFPDTTREHMDHVLDKENLPIHTNAIISNDAVTLIKKTLEESAEKVVILATGPLTNIAQFIEKYPHLKDRIEKIVIMGGAVFVEGNIRGILPESNNTVAEWNIYADPKSAEIVFAAGIPVTLVPLDATNQVPMTKEFYEALAAAQARPEIRLLYHSLTNVIDIYGEDLFYNHFYLWDPMAAMICLDPAIANTQEIEIVMDLHTAQTRPVNREAEEKGSVIRVATHIPEAKTLLMRFLNEMKLHSLEKIKVLPKVLPLSNPIVVEKLVEEEQHRLTMS